MAPSRNTTASAATASGAPRAISGLIDPIVCDLARIPGVIAVSLGGSHASGTAQADSDIDLGLYYREAAPFDVADVRALAERINERYFVTDKGTLEQIDAFPDKPPGYSAIVRRVLASPGRTSEELVKSAAKLERLYGEVRALCLAREPPLFGSGETR